MFIAYLSMTLLLYIIIYIILYHVISCHIAVHYITLYYIILQYITLHCIKSYYITLHHMTLHYIYPFSPHNSQIFPMDVTNCGFHCLKAERHNPETSQVQNLQVKTHRITPFHVQKAGRRALGALKRLWPCETERFKGWFASLFSSQLTNLPDGCDELRLSLFES